MIDGEIRVCEIRACLDWMKLVRENMVEDFSFKIGGEDEEEAA